MALDRLMRDTPGTALVIAQRVSTVRDADLILVLDEGKMVAKGTARRAGGDQRALQRDPGPSAPGCAAGSEGAA